MCPVSRANRTTSPEEYNSENQSGPEAVSQVKGLEQLEVRGRVRGAKCSVVTVQLYMDGRLDCCDQYRLDEVAKGLRVLTGNGLRKEHWTASPYSRCCQWRCPRDSDGGGQISGRANFPQPAIFPGRDFLLQSVKSGRMFAMCRSGQQSKRWSCCGLKQEIRLFNNALVRLSHCPRHSDVAVVQSNALFARQF